MPAPEGTPIHLQIAWENAWSFPPGQKPPGEYIGKIQTGRGTYYFYQDGEKYWYENEYDRQQAEKEAERRRRRWKDYSRNGRYGPSG